MTMDHKKQHNDAQGTVSAHVPDAAPSEEGDVRLPPHQLSSEDRAEKVRILKERVQSGSYKPDTLEVAYILTRFLDPES